MADRKWLLHLDGEAGEIAANLGVPVCNADIELDQACELPTKCEKNEPTFLISFPESVAEKTLIEAIDDPRLLVEHLPIEFQGLIELESYGENRYVRNGRDRSYSLTPDYLFRVAADDYWPRDENFANQWAMCKIRATEVWRNFSEVGNRSVVVAVIDSGYQKDHVDLKKNLWEVKIEKEYMNGKNFCRSCIGEWGKEWNIDDQKGHGTFVSGLIGAEHHKESKNSYVAGANRIVQMMILKAFDANGTATASAVEEAICFAKEYEADIISAAWLGEHSAGLKPRIEKSNALFVTAAGKGGKNIEEYPVYPAAYGPLANMVVVGATCVNDSLWKESNWGKPVEIGAPGWGISSDGLVGWAVSSGTSAATGLAVGAAALVGAHAKWDFDPVKLKCWLLNGAHVSNSLNGCVQGKRRLDAYGAVMLAQASSVCSLPGVQNLSGCELEACSDPEWCEC